MERMSYDELGRALIKEASESISSLTGEKDDNLTYLENYNKILEKIKSNEIKLYGSDEDNKKYIHLYWALKLAFEKKQTAEQQAQSGLLLISDYLDKIKAREKAEKTIVNVPLLMTIKEYDDMIKEITKSKLKRKESFNNLISNGFLFNYINTEQNPEIHKILRTTNFKRNLNDYYKNAPLLLEEHPNIYEILKADILQHEGLEKLNKVNPSEYHRKNINNLDLYNSNIYDYKEQMEFHSKDEIVLFISKNRNTIEAARAELRGFLMLNENNYSPEDLDINGYYIDPLNKLLKHLNGIEEIYRDNNTSNLVSEALDNFIVPGFNFICAFNSLMDLISEYYEIKELTLLKNSEFDVPLEVEEVNKDIDETWFSFTGTGIQTDKKRAMFRKLFTNFSLSEIETDLERVEYLRKYKDKFFPLNQKNLQDILNYLAGA